MTQVYSHAYADYPGMEYCPAHFHVESKKELTDIMMRHAIAAHGECAEDWTEEDRANLSALITEQ